jgi:trimeric autotransporter adhesin
VFTSLLHNVILYSRQSLLRGLAGATIWFFLAGISVFQAQGQQVSLSLATASAPAGSTVTVGMSLESSGGALPSALQWTLSYPSVLSLVTVDAGSSSTSAGKSVTCATSGDSATCVLFGLNTTAIGNGQLAAVTFLIAPSASGTASVAVANVVASNPSGSSIPASAAGGAITILQPPPPATLDGLTCSPTSVSAPGSSSCTVTLTGNAPSGGLAVALSSTNSNVTLPASVTVPAGAASAGFTATVAAIETDQTALLTAAAGGISRTFSLNLVAPALLSALNCTPSTLGSGQSATCTVTLTKALTTTSTIALTSTTETLSVPPSLTISAGASSGSFTATAGTLSVDQSATVSASWNGRTRSASLSLTAPATLSGLTCAASTILTPGSTECTITLTKAAPGGGFTVTLTSDNASTTIPGTVTVPAGAMSAGFTATAAALETDQDAVLTATASGVSRTFSLALAAPPQLSSLSCTPDTLGSGQNATCTVTLTKATTTSVAISLTSSTEALSVPTGLTISAGASSGSFTTKVGTLSVDQDATISASWNGRTRATTLSLVAAVTLSGLSCSASAINTPGSTDCTITLTKAAPSGGFVVTLSSDSVSITVPGTLTVPAGAATAGFTAAAAATETDQTAVITATAGRNSQTFSLTLSTSAQLSALSCAPDTLSSGQVAACTVVLTKAASAPVIINLSSSSETLLIPATVTIDAGASSGTFSATAGLTSVSQSVTLTAGWNSQTRTTTLSLFQPGPQEVLLSLESASATAGSTVKLNVSLASSGGALPTTVQWTMAYPSVLTVSSVDASSSAGGAGKSVTCAVNGGSTTCVAFGMNTTPIGDGSVALANFVIAPDAGSGAAEVALTNVVASNASGNSIPASGTGGSITIAQSLPPLTVSGLTCTPASVNTPGSSECTVTLNRTAGSSGFPVTLSSDNANLTIPGSVTVPSGASSADFAAAAALVEMDQSAVVTATGGGASQTFSLTLVAPARLSALDCAPQVLASGQSATCTVTLTRATATSITINLASSDPVLSVPPSLSVPAGAGSAAFTATAGVIGVEQTATVSATWNGQSRTASVSLITPAAVTGLTCAPASVNTPGSSDCSITLSKAAPAEGLIVTLQTDNTNVAVPATVTIPVGLAAAAFTATAAATATDQTAVLTATAAGISHTFSLALVSSAELSALSCAPETLVSGQSTSCTATLTKAATSPMTVTLASSQTVLSVPTSVTIPAGATSGTFTATAGTASVNQVVTVSATSNGQTQMAMVNLMQSGTQQVALSFNSASASSGSTVTLSLSATAAGGALPATLQWTVNYPAVLTALSTEAGSSVAATGKGVNCAVNGTSTTCVAFGMNTNAIGDGQVAKATFRIAPEAAAGVAEVAVSNVVASNAAGTSIPTAAFGGTITILPPAEISLKDSLLSDSRTARSADGLTARNAANPNSEAFCSPGSWAVLLGEGFSSEDPLEAQTVPLPLSLGKIRVRVNGSSVPLLFASASKISFQCPMLPAGTPIQVQVESEAGVEVLEGTMFEATPALYTLDSSGFGQGVILVAGTNDLAMPRTEGVASRPGRKGEYLSIYANGLGETVEELAAGMPAPTDHLVHAKNRVRVFLGGIEIEPAFAGLSPGAVALYQINAAIPEEVSTGAEVPLYVEVTLADGNIVTSNTVMVAIDEAPAVE